MKHFSTFMCAPLLVTLITLTACESTPENAEPVAALQGLPVATIQANGLSCPLCASNIDEVIARMPGVKQVQVDLGAGLIRVGLDPAADWPTAQQLGDAVRDAGFTPQEVTLPPKGAT